MKRESMNSSPSPSSLPKKRGQLEQELIDSLVVLSCQMDFEPENRGEIFLSLIGVQDCLGRLFASYSSPSPPSSASSSLPPLSPPPPPSASSLSPQTNFSSATAHHNDSSSSLSVIKKPQAAASESNSNFSPSPVSEVELLSTTILKAMKLCQTSEPIDFLPRTLIRISSQLEKVARKREGIKLREIVSELCRFYNIYAELVPEILEAVLVCVSPCSAGSFSSSPSTSAMASAIAATSVTPATSAAALTAFVENMSIRSAFDNFLLDFRWQREILPLMLPPAEQQQIVRSSRELTENLLTIVHYLLQESSAEFSLLDVRLLPIYIRSLHDFPDSTAIQEFGFEGIRIVLRDFVDEPSSLLQVTTIENLTDILVDGLTKNLENGFIVENIVLSMQHLTNYHARAMFKHNELNVLTSLYAAMEAIWESHCIAENSLSIIRKSFDFIGHDTVASSVLQDSYGHVVTIVDRHPSNKFVAEVGSGIMVNLAKYSSLFAASEEVYRLLEFMSRLLKKFPQSKVVSFHFVQIYDNLRRYFSVSTLQSRMPDMLGTILLAQSSAPWDTFTPNSRLVADTSSKEFRVPLLVKIINLRPFSPTLTRRAVAEAKLYGCPDSSMIKVVFAKRAVCVDLVASTATDCPYPQLRWGEPEVIPSCRQLADLDQTDATVKVGCVRVSNGLCLRIVGKFTDGIALVFREGEATCERLVVLPAQHVVDAIFTSDLKRVVTLHRDRSLHVWQSSQRWNRTSWLLVIANVLVESGIPSALAPKILSFLP